MIDWTARARAHLGNTSGLGTAKTDETRLLSVLSATQERSAPKQVRVSSVSSVDLSALLGTQGSIDISGKEGHGNSRCAEIDAQVVTRLSGNPYLTPAQGDECHVCGWDDTETRLFLVRQRSFSELGRKDAGHLAERLALRDRQADDRQICFECRELDSSRFCKAARRGALAGADARLQPVPNVLMRCTAFKAREVATPSPPGNDDENQEC